jgi:hypothetical protein
MLGRMQVQGGLRAAQAATAAPFILVVQGPTSIAAASAVMVAVLPAVAAAM